MPRAGVVHVACCPGPKFTGVSGRGVICPEPPALKIRKMQQAAVQTLKCLSIHLVLGDRGEEVLIRKMKPCV